MREYIIDCYGSNSGHKEIAFALSDVAAAGMDDVHFRFVFDDALKHNRQFDAGLFLDETAWLAEACYRYPKAQRFALLLETPIKPMFHEPERFEDKYQQIYTHYQPLIARGRPYVKFLYGDNWVQYDESPLVVPKKTRHLSFMGSLEHPPTAGYLMRDKVMRLLHGREDIDWYGKGICPVDSKREALLPYRYSITMENIRSNYYFTEKLMDCFLCECVPIYWGCPAITDIFDSRGMLMFDSTDQLYEQLSMLTVERYENMLPYVQANKALAIRKNWVSTPGIYQRLAMQLVTQLSDASATVAYPVTRYRQWLRRMQESLPCS